MVFPKYIAIEILVIISFCGFSQKPLNSNELVIVYESGCKGSCKLLYVWDDSCNSKVIEIHMSLKIFEKNNQFLYENGSLSNEKSKKLLSFFNSEKVKELKQILLDEEKENTLRFNPPKPLCYSFEHFQINYKSFKFDIWRLDNTLNRNGNELTQEENSAFEEFKSIIN